MEFINQLIESSKFASSIAVAAFLLSIFSFVWTCRSAKVSQQALKESIQNNNRNKESEIEKTRYTLLKTICEEFSLLEKQLTLIGALKADYDASLDVVKTRMGSSVKLFTETLPLIKKYKKDIEFAHLGAANWDAINGIPELLILQAKQDVAMVHTQSFVECNASLISDFREKLLTAQQSYFNNT